MLSTILAAVVFAAILTLVRWRMQPVPAKALSREDVEFLARAWAAGETR